MQYLVPEPSYSGVQEAWNTSSTQSVYCKSAQQDTSELEQRAIAAARKRFQAELGDSASVLMTLSTAKQSMVMIERRLSQLLRFTNALRRFKFSDAARHLIDPSDTLRWKRWKRLEASNKLRRQSRYMGSNFLEYSFGWRPLIGDMYTAADVLQRPIRTFEVVGRGRDSISYHGDSPESYYYWKSQHTATVRCRYSAEVYVDNPNLWLANRLGLINPAAAIFDRVPWSFVADWFVNFSDYMGQFGATAGLTILHPHYSVKTEVATSWQEFVYHPPAGKHVFNEGGSNNFRAFRRRLGNLPATQLKFRKPWIISPMRGANMISLLIQRIPKR